MTGNNTPNSESSVQVCDLRTWAKCVALAYVLSLPVPFLIATGSNILRGAPVPFNILTLPYFIATLVYVLVAWVAVGFKKRSKKTFLLTYGLTILTLGLAFRYGSLAYFAPQFLGDLSALAYGLVLALLESATFTLISYVVAGVVLRLFTKRYLVF